MRRKYGLIFLFSLFLSAQSYNVREKVGIYVWGEMPVSQEPLETAVNDLKILGANNARMFIGPYWDPRGDNPNNLLAPLDEKIKRSDYQYFLNNFGDSDRVIMITAYDLASYYAKYREFSSMSDDAKEILLSNVQEEFRRFTIELARHKGTFIISNWESENDVLPACDWEGYLKYLQARIDGIIEGRKLAESVGLPGKVFTAYEFVNANPLLTGDTDANAGIFYAPKLKGVDFLSYSSWLSIYGSVNVRSSFTDAVKAIRRFAKDNGITQQIIVGEFGDLYDYDINSVERLKIMIDASLEAGADYLFNWCMYDQPGRGVTINGKFYDQSHFGKFTLDRNITVQGKAFRMWFIGHGLAKNRERGRGIRAPGFYGGNSR